MTPPSPKTRVAAKQRRHQSAEQSIDRHILDGDAEYVDVATMHNASGSASDVVATLSATLVRAA